ncbi:hypothetical protein [Palleronia pelagia]|uniref:Uncharacterized protein n=1 Tax=Palleronia pelagia TaxID=387096 RepID=A0A1H8HX43_9RHOB|nr:hypothetical protein [Palleronia pelagia]SEN60476.1 hypothetical protein SAMN04488011_10526 [Palleronia pelagia]
MCMFSKPDIKAAPQIIAANPNREATRGGDMEARLRRARASRASSILTSPVGIPAGQTTRQLGAPA